jgi:electron transfer flavoprotein-quinone oxidoreductase
MEKFQVVVVGGGPAGSAAAYAASKAGAQTLVLERGHEVGSKTVSGGLLYTHVLKDLYGEFWADEQPPFERWISRYILGLLGESSATLIDHYNGDFGRPPYNSVSVLRSRLDKWLAQKAQEAGAVVATSTKVDSLLVDKGRVKGIVSGGDQIDADVVIICDGVNSLVSKNASFKGEWAGSTLGVGVKQLIELPTGKLEERFALKGLEGVEYTFIGRPRGVEGGGFVYTNRDTVSLGIILNLDSAVKNNVDMAAAIEDFKSHPFVSKLIADGTLLEYSACLVAEGGLQMTPKLYGDGYLVAGSAAGFVLNNGFNLRGMDFAIGSGRIAGQVAAEAVKRGDTSSTVLSAYPESLNKSFVLTHLRTYRNYPRFFSNKRLYDVYPEVVNSLMTQMYRVDGSDRGHLLGVLRRTIRGKTSIYTMLRDAWEAARNL